MGSKSSIIYILTTLAMAIAPAFAHAGSLPPLINFQSVLLDEGGNLLPSGPTTVQFQILDENQSPIYSETQSVEVVQGAVAALIGNGTDDKGTTTGGIPEDIFAGGAPRYLQVQVGSHAPEAPMTIVPVPYAQWSETCATVADGGIKSNAIAKAAVGFEALAPDVVSKLAAEMSKSQGVVTAQSIGSAGGATQVGVEAKFINSGSSSVQGVLQDIDLSVKKSQEMDTFLTGKLNQEVTDRTNAVAGVQSKLDQEVKDRSVDVKNLQDQITPITTTLLDINNIPGTLKIEKIASSDASPIPPVLTGEIKASDVSAGMKFIPFMPEVLAQSTCGDNSGHECVTATIPADNKLYYCKIGVKYTPGSHQFPNANSQPFPACEYTVIAKLSSVYDDDGPNMDMALQRGIVIRFLNSAPNPFESILYSVYELPIATQ